MLAHCVNEAGLVDLCADCVRLAVADLQRGRGFSLKDQRDYESACAFLERAGLLEKVVAHHQIELTDAPIAQLSLF